MRRFIGSIPLSSKTPKSPAGRVNHLTQMGVYLVGAKGWYSVRPKWSRRAVSGHCGVLVKMGWGGHVAVTYVPPVRRGPNFYIR
jgi:hypothetical protein